MIGKFGNRNRIAGIRNRIMEEIGRKFVEVITGKQFILNAIFY